MRRNFSDEPIEDEWTWHLIKTDYTVSNSIVPKKKIVHRQKHVRYLHKMNTIVFSILSAIKGSKFHISNDIIIKVCLFAYVINSTASLHCDQCRLAV